MCRALMPFFCSSLQASCLTVISHTMLSSPLRHHIAGLAPAASCCKTHFPTLQMALSCNRLARSQSKPPFLPMPYDCKQAGLLSSSGALSKFDVVSQGHVFGIAVHAGSRLNARANLGRVARHSGTARLCSLQI